jgi:hypothetical protein
VRPDSGPGLPSEGRFRHRRFLRVNPAGRRVSGEEPEAPTHRDLGLRIRLDVDPADGPVGAGDWYQIDVAGLPTQGGDSQTMGFDWYAAFADGAAPGFPNVTFSGTANDNDIDVLAMGRYDVEVEIHELGTGNVIVATAMNVMVVPLPPAAWAGLAGLAGAAVLRRRVLR